MITLVLSFFLIQIIDKRLNEILTNYLDIEVERLTTNVVNKAINELIIVEDYSDILNISRSSSGEIENISYNTLQINRINGTISDYLQNVLINLDNGDIDNFFLADKIRKNKFKKIKNGILCGITLGSVRKSTLFASLGPTIPIKLVFTGQITTDLDVKVHEYGINNIMVEIFLVVNVKEITSLPITVHERDIVIKEPISIDIIKGEIPSYYNGFR